MQPVIQTVHLYKRFGAITALDDVNITVARGEFVAIMGSSGSGKTTLMNILTCLDTPTEGQVLLNGTDAAALDEEARRSFRARTIGLVFQQFHLLPYLTACENVMLAQYYHSVTDKTAALAALERVGLAHRSDHLPKQLSGGEQQRVCIARALINEPEILFADEPTGNLDAENEQTVLRIFAELHAQNRTIVMVTHNPDLGAQTDRIIRLQHGKIQG
jgi:macrolide-specific ABC efflux carrier macB